MRFHADLHLHSKYSRATSRDLDLEHLAWWAARKGVAVLATGDCVHPQWLAELKEKLVPAKPGLFRLKPEIESEVLATLPQSCRAPLDGSSAVGSPARFMLSTEISTIYKKGEKTRKVHHLIYAPDFDAVDRLAARLASIGNIASDGRPILGLDSRDLLEIALESGPHSYLVPAHIWTPWFAALGSKSGFDSIEECYGDLADHIFAVETGLSSDPAMNWRISGLDRYRLTSNSDAHSPGKLAREATFFDCEPDYFAIRHALETGEGYGGTVEFFPEEGKYHADGHRKCGVRLSPKETLALDGRCPVCGGPLTVGVLHRIEALADRDEDEVSPPPTAGAVESLVPLPEILSEIMQVGAGSKRVAHGLDQALAKLGPELAILEDLPVEDIARAASPLLSEAVTRLRAGNVIRDAGYDGEYGVIRLFEDGELATLRGGDLLFDAPVAKRKKTANAGAQAPRPSGEKGAQQSDGTAGLGKAPQSVKDRQECTSAAPQKREEPVPILAALDAEQRAAASHVDGPLLVVAGPGSGKTRMLTHRIAHLVAECAVPPEACLAITFTRRAAGEMRERLAQLLPNGARDIPVHTFHSLGLAILQENPEAAGLAPGFRIAGEAERGVALASALDITEQKATRLLRRISKAKRAGTESLDEPLAEAIAAYGTLLATNNWVDFDDLVGLAVAALARDSARAEQLRRRWRFLSVDEFQDVDAAQYQLVTLLAPGNADLCAIGDPDQAIYGFRGADASSFERFRQDYPSATVLPLKRNYRSSGTIVSAASQIMASSLGQPPLTEIVRDMHDKIAIHAAASEAAEAEFVVAEIEALLGGHSFFSIDSGRARTGDARDLSFADIAVLYRTDAQSAALAGALRRAGMPFKANAHGALAQKPAVAALLTELRESSPDLPLADIFGDAADRLASADNADTTALADARRWLTHLAETCGGDRDRLFEAAALASEEDFFDSRADRIALLTMHAAKGLEFPVVFIVGMEDGLVPLRFGASDAASEAEERRLFYVAMTRAQDVLVLTRAERRLWRGERRERKASPYLADIEEELTRRRQIEARRQRPQAAQLTLL